MGKYPNPFYATRSDRPGISADNCKHKIRVLSAEERFGVLYNPNWLNGEQLAGLKIGHGTEDAVDSIRNQEVSACGASNAAPKVANEFPERIPNSKPNDRPCVKPKRVKYTKEELLKLRHRGKMLDTGHRHLVCCRCWGMKQYSVGKLLTLRHDRSDLQHRHLYCCKNFRRFRAPRFNNGNNNGYEHPSRSY